MIGYFRGESTNCSDWLNFWPAAEGLAAFRGPLPIPLLGGGLKVVRPIADGPEALTSDHELVHVVPWSEIQSWCSDEDGNVDCFGDFGHGWWTCRIVGLPARVFDW